MMEENNEVRIGRFLSGEAGRDERLAFESELQTNPVLKQDFLAYQKIWENTGMDHQEQWNSSSAWELFSSHNFIDEKTAPPVRKLNLQWAAAAVVLIAAGLFFFLWRTGRPDVYVYNEKEVAPLELADGSKVYLNHGASLKVYPFTQKKRRVALIGEAFFEVNPDSKRPFTVSSGGTITEVVGTAFNITQTEESTRIFVERGKVIFKAEDKGNEAVALTAGEAAVFNDQRMQRIPNPSPNINAWHTRNLSFTSNMSLAEILEDASVYFKKQISLENVALKDCHLSSHLMYTDPELNTVLKPIASFVNGSIRFDGDKCIISGGNCP